ncbi:MAG: hypothetical protein C0468_06435 [Planctomyces sp.]|nr:hypothetical protein [Planctomyces sp.]MBA4119982.1 hypothetical protein [Isosphaera sp.]
MHALPAGVAVVVVRVGADGSLSLEQSRVLAAGASRLADIGPADEVLGVVPAGAVALRVVKGPALDLGAPPQAVTAAMALLAETHAPGVPAHRRAAGALWAAPEPSPAFSPSVPAHGLSADAQASPAVPTAVVLWQGPGDELADLARAARVARWAPEQVCLAWLSRALGAGPGVSLLADPSSGVIAAIAQRGGLWSARSLREDPQDAAAWSGAIAELTGALARAAGLGPAQGHQGHGATDGPVGRLVQLPAPAAPRRGLVSGVPDQPGWLETFGMALGAACAAALATPPESALLEMTRLAPTRRARPLSRLLVGVGRPVPAGALLALAGAMLLGGPYLSARAELRRAQARAAAEPLDQAALAQAMKQADQYALLSARRWPVARLLAETLASAPAGVRVERVTVEIDKPITVSGRAPSADVVSEWRTALQALPAFKNATAATPRADAGAVAFEVSVEVSSPADALAAEPDELSRRVALVAQNAERITLDGAPALAPPGPTRGRQRQAQPGSAAAASPAQPAAAAASEPREIPAPLSDQAIAALDRAAAVREFGLRQRGSRDPQLDAPTRQRLSAEAQKLRDRLGQLNRGAGGRP